MNSDEFEHITPIEEACAALNGAVELSVRIESLVARLIGHPATSEASSDQAPKLSGILPSLGDDAARAERFLRAAHSELDRLDRNLPDGVSRETATSVTGRKG